MRGVEPLIEGRGGFEGGWLDWKSCVQGIFRPPPNHYCSLHQSLDNDAEGGGDKD